MSKKEKTLEEELKEAQIKLKELRKVIQEKNLELIFATNDLYKNCPADREELTKIKTYYEGLFTAKGEDIKYCCFKLD